MLTFVPVPIGNLGDITLRAIETLKTAHILIAEDPRVTGKLLMLLGITYSPETKPKYITYIRNNEFNQAPIYDALESLKLNDQNVVVVSDAGTPGISDPGFLIIRKAQELGLTYTILPGATALIPAAVGSGLIGKEFTFLGFLPLKKGRQTLWKWIALCEYPVVIYESNHRIAKFIVEAQTFLTPNTQISIAREISKLHEQYWMGTVAELDTLTIVEKGEFVIVIRNV